MVEEPLFIPNLSLMGTEGTVHFSVSQSVLMENLIGELHVTTDSENKHIIWKNNAVRYHKGRLKM
jgi:hypothetical protein